MIVFLTTLGLGGTFKSFFNVHGNRLNVRVKSYDWLFSASGLPAATYVFTDIERLASYELVAAGSVYAHLKAHGQRVLNNPALVQTRYALLHQLHKAGVNPFAAYRAETRPQPAQWPVFVRNEADHSGLLTGLLENQAELDAELARLQEIGISLRDLLVIEYCAEEERPGAFIKHQIFRAGDNYLTQTSVRDDNWYVKHGIVGLSTDDELEAGVARMDEGADVHLMHPVFDMAHIEYGRVDYAYVGGKPVVYEINTNPTLGYVPTHRYPPLLAGLRRTEERLVAALKGLDTNNRGTLPGCKEIALRRDFSMPVRVSLKRP